VVVDISGSLAILRWYITEGERAVWLKYNEADYAEKVTFVLVRLSK
jgi:hypothetical protein